MTETSTEESKLSPIKIQIRSFQSIDALDLEVSGFTCITGPSNIGKSAIIRAVSGALLNNSVVGDVRKGQRYCSVEFETLDYKFKWNKGEKVNQYFINDAEKPLDKIGQNPIEFIESKGFKSIRAGNKEFYPWFASQFEPLFLFDQTGSTITDFISGTSKLDLIQNAISINLKQKNRLIIESRVKERSTAELRKKYEKLDHIDKLVQLKSDLVAQLQSIESYDTTIKIGRVFYTALEKINRRIQIIESVNQVKANCDNLKDKLDEYKEMKKLQVLMDQEARRIIKIKGVTKIQIPKSVTDEFTDFESCVKFYRKIKSIIDKINQLSLNFKIPSFDGTLGGLDKVKTTMSSLDGLRTKIKQLESELDQNNKQLELINEEIGKIPLCPTCNHPIDECQTD